MMYCPCLAKGLAMSDARAYAGVLSPDEVALIDRVLGRANEKLLLNKAEKEDEAALAVELYQECGFTNQLLDQLLQALRPRHRR